MMNDDVKELSTNAILAHTEDALLSMESLQSMISRTPIDSIQWFYVSSFLNDLQHHLETMRQVVDKDRPSRQVRQMLLESFVGIAPKVNA